MSLIADGARVKIVLLLKIIVCALFIIPFIQHIFHVHKLTNGEGIFYLLGNILAMSFWAIVLFIIVQDTVSYSQKKLAIKYYFLSSVISICYSILIILIPSIIYTIRNIYDIFKIDNNILYYVPFLTPVCSIGTYGALLTYYFMAPLGVVLALISIIQKERKIFFNIINIVLCTIIMLGGNILMKIVNDW